MLYLIGLGLGDVTDITVKGLETVRKCDKVFLEAYTSLLLNSELDTLEKYYDKEITIADREMVESESALILDPALTQDVAFLVVGDPLGATTHTDIILRAIKKGISYRVIHNASIMNAVASTGLQLYNFGDTVSICFWKENWKPTSFVDKIIKNLRNGLHVLCLLDIRVSLYLIFYCLTQNVPCLCHCAKGRDTYRDITCLGFVARGTNFNVFQHAVHERSFNSLCQK